MFRIGQQVYGLSCSPVQSCSDRHSTHKFGTTTSSSQINRCFNKINSIKFLHYDMLLNWFHKLQLRCIWREVFQDIWLIEYSNERCLPPLMMTLGANNGMNLSYTIWRYLIESLFWIRISWEEDCKCILPISWFSSP